MLIQTGKQPAALANTAEETEPPVTAAGAGEVAFLIGPPTHQQIAMASIATGRITRRIAFNKGEVISLASSTDASTLYASAGQSIWSIPVSGGEPKEIGHGQVVNASPDGQWLLTWQIHPPMARLLRVSPAGRFLDEIKQTGPL
jgi:hypothetical protein